jgi:hypothetical protein
LKSNLSYNLTAPHAGHFDVSSRLAPEKGLDGG